VENEVCPVYAAHIVSPLQLNADEVMDYQWSDLEYVLSGIDATPWAFSPWMVMQVSNKEARAQLRNYCQQIIA
jgi:isopentenyl-diphosphate delta-isomerase